MCWPLPVVRRPSTAARIPMVACRPVMTSTSATPTFVGSPFSAPDRLMSQPTAWTSRSYPGNSLPSLAPKSEIEQ